MPEGLTTSRTVVQHGELALLKLGQKPLLKDEEVAVPLVPAEQPLGGGHPLGQPLVDAR